MQKTPPAIEPDSFLGDLKWGIIVRGALVDFLLSLVLILPVHLYFAGPDFLAEDAAVANAATAQAYESFACNATILLVGLSCTVAGALWSARRVTSLHVRHGGWVAVVSLLLVVPFLLVPGALDVRQPVWAEALGFLGMIPAGMLGGHLGARVPRPAA
jgi:hypothetical protein